MNGLSVSWIIFKQFIQERDLSIQYIDINDKYYMLAFDGGFEISCVLDKDGSDDVIDFENSFKSNANQKLDITDSDGAILQRLKVTTTGWSLHYHGLEITTSDLDGAIDLDHNNKDYRFTTIKLYDSDDIEITDPNSVSSCVKTVIDWEPTFDYDIIGGDVFLASAPSTDIRVNVIGVPDVPAKFGGSKVFMTGFNLKYVSPLGIHLDGKTPKSTKYNPTYHTNKIRFVFFHDAGVSQTVLVMLNIFKA